MASLCLFRLYLIIGKMSPTEGSEELARLQAILPDIEAGDGRTPYQQVHTKPMYSTQDPDLALDPEVV